MLLFTSTTYTTNCLAGADVELLLLSWCRAICCLQTCSASVPRWQQPRWTSIQENIEEDMKTFWLPQTGLNAFKGRRTKADVIKTTKHFPLKLKPRLNLNELPHKHTFGLAGSCAAWWMTDWRFQLLWSQTNNKPGKRKGGNNQAERFTWMYL